ncbi:response regulator transcription factor [Aggregicoccus sp. 17bor-14]|nr:response regulator transcription factor [Simulacricoccus sp. 17bor-14]MRI91029.1 response regulator transcription factor [Aggregicoccus sp. 17bor-14]
MFAQARARGEPLGAGPWELLAELQRAWPEVHALVLVGGPGAATGGGLDDAEEPALAERALALGAHDVVFTARDGVHAVLEAVAAVGRGERRMVQGRLGGPSPSSMSAPELPGLLLTPRERDVLRYIAHGMDNLKIAAHMNITERTVKAHVTQLYRKLRVENRAEMALRARGLGLQLPLSAPGPARSLG